MKPFDELTKLGRIRRLRPLVFEALEAYDVQVEQVKFFTIETNTMFQIRTVEGEKLMLRIYSEEETTIKENQAEMYWLNALIRDTDLKVTEPVARRDGDYISTVRVASVPGERRCALFKWIPGRTLENSLSPENYFIFGQSLAKLHNHSSLLKPLPAHIQPKKWDKVFYYPDEPVVYNTPEFRHQFPPERIGILEKVIDLADGVFARIFANKEDQILIHGDLHYWNVHLHRGELYLIDFEDINLGYPIQDIAVTLYYGRDREGYPEWKAAFKDGYSSIRDWPVESERTLQTLMAARTAMFINYVARIDPSPEEFIEQRCEALEEFLENLSK